METLTRLKARDLKISIDDFGTGYSSLSYLERLPVDAIKIDQSFVSTLEASRDSETIVRCTIELAHNLDLDVTAEGIENEATWKRLAALGCDVAQGYWIGKPIPAGEFGNWLAHSPWDGAPV